MSGCEGGARLVGALALLVALSGCDSAEVKKCHAAMQSSQEALLVMESRDRASVTEALSGIDGALAACKEAGRKDEVADILDARRTLMNHLEELDRRAAEPKAKPLSPEELAKLEKDGDPSCPRGQGYRHEPSKKVIRCTGKSVVEMNWAEASEHLAAQRFGVMAHDQKPILRAERGAERFLLTFAEKESKQAPVCTEITAAPGIPWQEVVTRNTSAAPDGLELGKPVKVGSRELPLRVEGDAKQWSVFLGDCPKSGTEETAPPVAGSAPADSPQKAAPK